MYLVEAAVGRKRATRHSICKSRKGTNREQRTRNQARFCEKCKKAYAGLGQESKWEIFGEISNRYIHEHTLRSIVGHVDCQSAKLIVCARGNCATAWFHGRNQ
jgi:hypothetical protein